MVNAWSLLYDEYYGTMNETFPVNNEEPDDYERKGAASFAWLFALPLLWFRRRYSNT